MTARRIAALTLLTSLICFGLTTGSQATTTVTNLSPSFGTVGATVTIYGTNFGSTRGTVTFYNGKSATISSWNGTTNEIMVTVPTGATNGLVTVTPHGGTGVTSTVDFNVLATDASLVLGVFPPQSSTCSFLPSGNNCITQYQSDVLPNVDGIVVEVQWSSIDLGNASQTGSGCTSGASSSTCNWSALDTLVTSHYFGGTNWDASKKVGIVLSPVTDGMGSSGVNTSTPAYVFSTAWAGTSAPLDECTCSGASGYNGDGATGTVNTCWNISTGPTTPDYSGYPAVFEEPFQNALQAFYQNAVSHLNSLSTATYSSSIAYIRMGLAGGGEAYPFCASNLETLSSVSPHTAAQLKYVWTTYANNMYIAEAGFGSLSPIMAAPSGSLSGTIVTNAWADAEASDAIAEGLVLGSEGFQYQDTNTAPCSNDWCTTFTDTPIPQIRELQLVDPSVPSQNNCSGGSGYTVGSLVCLLPFAEGKANSLELFPQDLFIAYDSNDSNYSTYGTAYATAISHLRAGT